MNISDRNILPEAAAPAEAIAFAAPPISDASGTPPSSNRPESVVVARPSVEAGSTYKQVSRAYIDAVHSVLTGKRQAPEVAAELEKQLIGITGSYLDSSALSKRYRAALRRAALRPLRFHDLRHAFGTRGHRRS